MRKNVVYSQMVAVILAYDNEMIFIIIMNGIRDFLVKKAENDHNIHRSAFPRIVGAGQNGFPRAETKSTEK